MADDGQPEKDQLLGANIRAAREERGMSQAELARLMTARGWPWHQSTVSSAEAGRQPLRFWEVQTVTEILGVTLDRLTWLPPEAAEHALVARARTRLREAWEDAADAIGRLHAARSGARAALRDFGESTHAAVRETVAGLADDLRHDTPNRAAVEGRARYRKE